MKEMRSSREVILPKMSFRLGAIADMKRNAFFLYIYEENAFISARLVQVGRAGRGAIADVRASAWAQRLK